MIYLEILNNNAVVAICREFLSNIRFKNEIMFVPEFSVTIPINYLRFFSGRASVKLHINGKVFYGLVFDHEIDKQKETITLNVAHIIYEWKFEEISTNLAIKDKNIGQMYSTLDFKYSTLWNIIYGNNAQNRNIDYVYSKQNKLDALDKTVELTNDLFWRVQFDGSKNLYIGTFGVQKDYRLSTKQSSEKNIRIIDEPVIDNSYENVVNMSTVYGTKSDNGMSSLSLREVYNDTSLQVSGFPVIIRKTGINNERKYTYANYPKLAPNNELEYAILDEESIALESGTIIEKSFSFDDINPFELDGEDISDNDRIKASKTVYDMAVKTLRNSRRSYTITLRTEELPNDIAPGDKIRLIYDNNILIQDDCSNYLKKVMKIDDWYYILSIDYDFDETGGETNTIKLGKYLKIERESGY